MLLQYQVRDGNYACDKEAPGTFMHERDTVAPLIDLSDPAEGTTAYDNPEGESDGLWWYMY